MHRLIAASRRAAFMTAIGKFSPKVLTAPNSPQSLRSPNSALSPSWSFDHSEGVRLSAYGGKRRNPDFVPEMSHRRTPLNMASRAQSADLIGPT